MASDTQSDSMKSSKKQSEPKKVLDVSRPKRRPAATGPATAPQLVIPKRSVMVTVADSPDTSSDPVAPATPGQTTSAPVTPRRTVIEPSTAPEVKSADGDTIQVAKPGVAADAKKPAENPVDTATVKPKTTQPTAAAPESTKEDTPTPSETPAASTSEADSTDDASQDTPDEPEADPTNAGAKPSDADVRKALEDAKREEEIRGYIDKHEFFVPINSIARKRNIKVTLLLVALELVLGLFLLNLMLDAGLIYLLQKIPHTHFFDLQ